MADYALCANPPYGLIRPTLLAIQPPDSHAPRAAGLDLPDISANETGAKMLASRIRHADFIRVCRMLDPCGHVHRVAPQVIGKTVPSDHARDRRPGMDADP